MVSENTGSPAMPPFSLQGPTSQPPEEELERLTKKLVHDMSHPPSGEYFGEPSRPAGEDTGGEGEEPRV